MKSKANMWKIIVYLILVILAVLSILPFYWMITTSFKTPAESIAMPPTWFPKTLTTSAY